MKERLARESDLEVNAEPKKRKLLNERDCEELGMSDQEGFSNKGVYDDESGLTEVEKVQSALARIKDQLSRDKDAKELSHSSTKGTVSSLSGGSWGSSEKGAED